MEIGAQFYTIREFCKTPEDFALSLKKVADIGYKTVQISGTCAYEPEWLAAELKKNDLRCVITHIAADKLTGDPVQVAKDHDVFGCDYVGLGAYFGFKPGDDLTGSVENFANTYKPVAQALRDNGKYFMYHNHDMEFQHIGGKPIFELISEIMAPDEMGFTLDTYWVQVGGGDPAWWIDKLAGRLPCIHLKDCGYGRRMEAVGEGNINFDSVFKAAEAAGTKFMLVEQDNCNGDDPFDCLKRSYDFLHAHGFN